MSAYACEILTELNCENITDGTAICTDDTSEGPCDCMIVREDGWCGYIDSTSTTVSGVGLRTYNFANSQGSAYYKTDGVVTPKMMIKPDETNGTLEYHQLQFLNSRTACDNAAFNAANRHGVDAAYCYYATNGAGGEVGLYMAQCVGSTCPTNMDIA